MFSGSALAQFDDKYPPPDWMVRGFEAAVADPASVTAIESNDTFSGLAQYVFPSDATVLVDKLLPLLGDSNSDLRLAAAKVLGQLVPSDHAGAVVDKLGPLLVDSEQYVRSAAAHALGQVKPGDRVDALVDKLLPLLGASDSVVRAGAAKALGQVTPGDRAGMMVNKLLPLLDDSASDVRSAAAESLGKITPGDRASAAVAKLLPLLGDSAGDVRSAADKALEQMAPGDRAGASVAKLLPLLGDSDRGVRSEAAYSLGQITLGDRASAVVDKLLLLLDDSAGDVRLVAAESLGIITPGNRAGAVVDKLLPLLDDSASSVRPAAAESLGKITPGDRAGAVVDKLLPLLGDSHSNVRSVVAESLGQITPGDRAGAVVDKLLPLLEDVDQDLQAAAAQALGRITPGDRAGAVVDKLLPLVDAASYETQSAAVQSLGQITPSDRLDVVVDKLLPGSVIGPMSTASKEAQALANMAAGNRASAMVDKLLPLLGSSDGVLRQAAGQTLGQITPEDRAGAVVDKLLPLLDDSHSNVRSAVAQSLGQITPANRAGAVVDKLLPLLGDSEKYVRVPAAYSLGQITPEGRADAVVDKLLPLLVDSDSDIQHAAIWAIARIGPGGVSTSVIAVRLINAGRDEETGPLRTAAYVATGADAKKEGSELLLAWLGRPAALPLNTVENEPAAAHRFLKLLTDNWAALSKEPRARDEAENAAMAAIQAACRAPSETSSFADLARASFALLRDLPIEGPIHGCWTREQKSTMERLLADFKASHSTHEKALEADLKSEDFAPLGLWLTRSLVAWTLLWAAFLVAFPWSRTIQAIFFWNPRARQFFSAGFVPLLLLVLPPLRRRLLAPFRDDLVAQARFDDLPQLGYFAHGRARDKGGELVPVSQLRLGARGVAVLQADSGLGKTSLLREMAANATRPVAFLHARDCADGVDVAISRIIHNVQETGFVRSLVHTRALMVIVDGLNEVSADTREKIGAFARDMSKGDVVVATQPIEWRPPPNSRIVELLPLNRGEATVFIESRPVGTDPTQSCHGPAYKAAVGTFVSRALDEAPSELERETAALMLSNPFDLAFAAELLARGRMPTPTALVDEAFRLADERHREVTKVPFPLEAFGRHAVGMRLEDRNWLIPDAFPAEVSCLLEQRLLVARGVKGAQGVVDRLLFRHDRVWDFFIAAVFADDPDLWAAHVNDARFRGAYLRIAETWDPESAKKVRDHLNVSAAESGDHSTSDEFIKRLEKRLRAKKARPARAVARPT
jgi:HEAT repeat protein